MDSLVISLVDCSNGQKVALISESRGDLGFDVRISNGSTVYRFDNLVGYESRPPNRTREARETYMAALQGAFQPSSNANDQNPKSSFSYDATLSGDALSFVVKQRSPGESHYLLLHKAEYKAVPNSAQELLSLLENVNAILAAKDEEVNYIREDSQYFKDSMDTLQSDRDNFAVWKESLQDRLIRGFCCVLNSKKREIARLQSELNALRGTTTRKKASKAALEPIAEDEGDGADDGSSVASSVASTSKKRGKRTATTTATAKSTRGARGRKKGAVTEDSDGDENGDGSAADAGDNDEAEEEEEEVPKARRATRATRGVALAGTKTARGRKATATKIAAKEEKEEAALVNTDSDEDAEAFTAPPKTTARPPLDADDATDDEAPPPTLTKWINPDAAPGADRTAAKAIVLVKEEPLSSSSLPLAQASQSYVSSYQRPAPSMSNNLLFSNLGDDEEDDEDEQSDRDLLADEEGDVLDGGAAHGAAAATSSFDLMRSSSQGGARSFKMVGASAGAVTASAALPTTVDGGAIASFLAQQSQSQLEAASYPPPSSSSSSSSVSRKRSADDAGLASEPIDEAPTRASTITPAVVTDTAAAAAAAALPPAAASVTAAGGSAALAALQARKKSKASKFLAEADSDDD